MFMLLLFVILTKALAEDKEPSSKDILGMWHFDEGQGEIAEDSSGNGNTLKIIGAIWVDGHKGKCLYFDGKGSCAFLEKCSSEFEPSFREFTISCWIKPEYEYPKTMFIVNNAVSPNGTGFRLYFYYGALEFCFGKGEKSWKIRTPKFKDGIIPEKALPYGVWYKGILDKRWYHIAITYKDSLYTIYVDGRIACEKKGETILLSKHRMIIGARKPENIKFSYKGLIDEVEILQRAKSGHEIIEEVFPDMYF
jgi:hypothetical protein